ncbi:hypothetical protein [Listeria sp. PSOL-1]|uniref:hypothetical protein n=1 Tax=Listeria sp. PSOL-1 TaxID=1844999 RepID=UPI0013D737BC|nr:hypothetical protein [Listeria sp. PSOL-1]
MFKYGKKLRFKDITKGASRKNFTMNISRRQLQNRLKKSGWKKTRVEPKNKKIYKYTKKGRKIVTRKFSKDGRVTADYSRKKGRVIKFRLRR